MFENHLKGGNACRYELTFPMDAGKYDQILLKVPKLENMDLFAVDTRKYGSE